MDHVTLGNPSRKDREKRQTAKSGDDSAISQRTAANRSAKDSYIPPLSSSEVINPPGRQEDRNISPTSLPQPDGDAPNLHPINPWTMMLSPRLWHHHWHVQ